MAISPERTLDEDDLRCPVTTEAADPNGDAVTYAYARTADGEDDGRDVDMVPADPTDDDVLL